HKLGSRGLLENNRQPIVAVEGARFAQDFLDSRIMLVRVELKRAVLHFPAGKAAGKLLNVLFGVISQAKAEELHHFAGEILVGMVFSVGRGVQIKQHRRIASDSSHEIREFAEGMLPEQVVLLEDQAGITDLGGAGREMPMPKQSCLF